MGLTMRTAILISACLFMGTGCQDSFGKPSAKIEAKLVPASRPLWVEFRDNRIAADAKYMGRYVVAEGESSSVSRTESGTYFVRLGVNKADGSCEYYCLIPKDAETAFSKLPPRSSIRVKGKVAKVNENPSDRIPITVTLEDCRLDSH